MDKSENFDIEDSLDPQRNVTDFVELVVCIMEYYGTEARKTESEEVWKRGSQYETKNIPDNINDLVEGAFITQLKKFN